MNPSIAVIIPVRNGEATVAQAIQSVLRQTFTPAEILVIDDNSTDSTLKVLEEFGSKIQILRGPGLGAGPARNLGVQVARSQYIAFLDADDFWEPEKLSRQIPFLKPGVIVGTYAKYVSGPRQRRVGTSLRTPNDEHANQLLIGRVGMPALLSSWVIFKEDLLAKGLFDPNYIVAQDYELIMRLVSKGQRIVIVRQELVRYSIHAVSETATSYINQYLTAQYVRECVSDQSTTGLEEWLDKAKSDRKKMKSARAGLYFRKALVHFSSPATFPLVLYCATISICLDPVSFMKKLFSQGPLHGKLKE